jgi:hypothetical protein
VLVRNRCIKNGLMFLKSQREQSKTTIEKFDMKNEIILAGLWFR